MKNCICYIMQFNSNNITSQFHFVISDFLQKGVGGINPPPKKFVKRGKGVTPPEKAQPKRGVGGINPPKTTRLELYLYHH